MRATLPFPAAAAEALSVSDVLDRVRRGIRAALPGAVWIHGEVARFAERSGRCEIELVDPECASAARPMLSCVCWQEAWGPLRRRLAFAGAELREGLRVSVRGEVKLWPAASRVQIQLLDLNVEELVGRLALSRQHLVERLRVEGIFDANRALPPPVAPQSIGVVGGSGTHGVRDLLAKVCAAPWSMRLVVAEAPLEGAGAPGAIAAALAALGGAHRRGDVHLDLIALVRGGGARAALAPFDTEPVVRALLASPVPVWTGIGHDADRTLADEVAHRSWRTPTECAEALLGEVDDAWGRSLALVSRAGALAGRRVEGVRHRLDSSAQRSGRSVVHRIALADAELSSSRSRLAGRTGEALREAQRARLALQQRLGQRAPGALRRASEELERQRARARGVGARVLQGDHERLEERRRALEHLHPARTLERGYALVRRVDGGALRSVEQASLAQRLEVVLADGVLGVVVDRIAPAPGSGPSTPLLAVAEPRQSPAGTPGADLAPGKRGEAGS